MWQEDEIIRGEAPRSAFKTRHTHTTDPVTQTHIFKPGRTCVMKLCKFKLTPEQWYSCCLVTDQAASFAELWLRTGCSKFNVKWAQCGIHVSYCSKIIRWYVLWPLTVSVWWLTPVDSCIVTLPSLLSRNRKQEWPEETPTWPSSCLEANKKKLG